MLIHSGMNLARVIGIHLLSKEWERSSILSLIKPDLPFMHLDGIMNAVSPVNVTNILSLE